VRPIITPEACGWHRNVRRFGVARDREISAIEAMLEFNSMLLKMDVNDVQTHHAELKEKFVKLSTSVIQAHGAFVHALECLARQSTGGSA
jgi:hypothetical protein